MLQVSDGGTQKDEKGKDPRTGNRDLTMTKYRMPLRIVLYRHPQTPDRWFAHCLELDLVGDGASKREALTCLEDAIKSQVQFCIDSDTMVDLVCSADSIYHRMYFTGKDVADMEIHIDPMEGVEFIDCTTRECEALEGCLAPG